MPKPGRTRPVSALQVRAYAAKAQEFAEAAASDLDAGPQDGGDEPGHPCRHQSADAVCGARLGTRAAGADHDRVLVLLRQAGPDGAEVERDLRRLLPLKTKAEYEPDDIAPSVATVDPLKNVSELLHRHAVEGSRYILRRSRPESPQHMVEVGLSEVADVHRKTREHSIEHIEIGATEV